MIRCTRCSRIIDSDDDPSCFVDDGAIIACGTCRAQMEECGELNVETNTTERP